MVGQAVGGRAGCGAGKHVAVMDLPSCCRHLLIFIGVRFDAEDRAEEKRRPGARPNPAVLIFINTDASPW